MNILVIYCFRFCSHVHTHKNFSYEQFRIQYRFIDETVGLSDVPLHTIQLYRRPFAYLLFTVCHNSNELRLAFEQYTQLKQRLTNVYTHLFVRYRSSNVTDDVELVNDDKYSNKDTYVNSNMSIDDYLPIELIF
jgi:hypothetical protein